MFRKDIRLQGVHRFNRNIVECKVDEKNLDLAAEESFNRNIVECKAESGGTSLS